MKSIKTATRGRAHLHCVQALDSHLGGGLASATLGLHQEMIRGGTSSRVVSTSGDDGGTTQATVHEYRRAGMTKMFFAPELWRSAPELVGGADVIHLHGLYAATNWAVGRTARRRQTPLVYHPHGMLEPYILQRSRLKKKIACWLYETANIKAATLWRALTPIEADQIRAFVPDAKVVVIPNGVEFHGDEKKVNAGRKRIGYLGRIHEKKGLPMLLEAWARLEPQFPEWELSVRGPGSPQYVEHVRSLAARIPRAIVSGPVSGREKSDFISSLDLFVLPSLSEGFPMAVLEAMAMGVPVAVTRTSNAPDVASNGAGWTCDATVPSIHDALRTALSCGAQELTARGAAARDIVRRDYTWERVAAALVQACEAV